LRLTQRGTDNFLQHLTALADEHPVIRRHREADAFLTRVADGRETLGQSPSGTAGAPATSVDAPARLFTRDTLADYR
ncbi:MAG: hypothetical protein MZV65_00860, partial [Chromatiales bacterium]|nr:hypothetical protein [Chromatiales bacterium]